MPSEDQLISVIIPNFNYSHFLTETINSVLQQSYSNLECIIVDDGSTDDSKDVIDELQKKDDRIKTVYKSNGGLSSARNAGIKKAEGAYVSFLDADDLWKKEKIAHQLNCIEQFPKADFVFSNYEGFYDNGTTDPFQHEYGDTDPLDFIKLNPIAGSASSVLLSKELIDKVGYFDENLKSTEDHDYWFRCMVAGATIKFCDKYDVRIRLHQYSMSKNQNRMNENNFKVLIKQLRNFPDNFKQKDIERFKGLVNSKMQSLLWIARDTRDKKLILNIYKYHIKFLGLGFTFRNFIKKNMIYDMRLIINLN